MKTVQELNAQIDQLKKQISKEEKVLEGDIQNFVEDLLKSHYIINEGDEVQSGEGYTYVKRVHPEVSYTKDMFTLYHSSRFGEDQEVEVNYYTGGATNDPWELNRLVALGKMAGFLENKETYSKLNDGIAKLKSITEPIVEELYSKKLELEKQATQIAIEEEGQKQEQFLQDLKQGVEFEEPVSFGNTSRTFNGVVGLKVTSTTASGKTAQLEITLKDWRGDIYTLKAKMKVESFEDLHTKAYTVS